MGGGASQGPGSQHCLWNRFDFTWHQKRVECCWTAATPEVTFERGAAMWCLLWVRRKHESSVFFTSYLFSSHQPAVVSTSPQLTLWSLEETPHEKPLSYDGPHLNADVVRFVFLLKCGFQCVTINTTWVHFWCNNNHFPSAALNSVACCCFRWLNTETTVTTQSHFSQSTASLLHSLIYEETVQLLVHSQQRNIMLWFNSSEAEMNYTIC